MQRVDDRGIANARIGGVVSVSESINATNIEIGKVYLVGAGPGDPDLITVKGLRLLSSADVVVYDRLIPKSLLDQARPDAELIDAGKSPRHHRLTQDEIN